MINQNSEMLNKLFFTELQMLVEKYNKIDEVTKKKIESIITRLKDKELQSYLMNNPNKLLELVKNIDEIDEEVVIFFTWYNLEIKTIGIHKAKECTEELRVNKKKGTAVCNSNSVKAEVIVNNLIEIVNNELLLKKVINNINKNKSSKLKPKLDEMNLVNKEIDKLNGKKDSSIELFEDGIRYLVKEGSSEEDEDLSFFHVSILNCTCLKFVI